VEARHQSGREPEEHKHVAVVTHLMTRAGNWVGGLRWIVRRTKPSRRQMRNLTAYEKETGWRYSIIWMLDRIGQRCDELAGQAEHLRKQLVDIELELADLIAAERVVGRMLAEPGAGSSGFHVADELVVQSVP
jgi:hypothetical protein